MSADGEIEVAVKAEGVDDAAADIEDETADGGGGDGGGGDGGRDGVGGALRAGAIAGVIISALGPLLDVLDPIQEILAAFLAPIAALLLRQLAPVLNWLIRLLPGWFEFVRTFEEKITNPIVNFLTNIPTSIREMKRELPGLIKNAFDTAFGWLSDGASKIGSQVWAQTTTSLGDVKDSITGTLGNIKDEITSLPGDIRSEIARILPDRFVNRVTDSGGDSGGGSLGTSDVQTISEGTNTAVKIALGGGLDTLLERIEANPNRGGSP